MSKAEERSLARDFLLARLAACRGGIARAAGMLDLCLEHFVHPDTDKRGTIRSKFLESIDDSIGEAATALHAAQELMGDIDPKEGEPDLDDDDDDEEEDEDEEDEEDEDD